MKVFFIRHGETQTNVENKSYIDGTEPITQKGVSQAILAGKYLKQFGKFDLVISSPATRCKLTAENICKEINYTKKIKTNDLLYESISKNLINMSQEEIKEYVITKYYSHSTYNKIYHEYMTTTDPFKRIELYESSEGYYNSVVLGNDTDNASIKKLKKFLSEIKKLNKKCILVVGQLLAFSK